MTLTLILCSPFWRGFPHSNILCSEIPCPRIGTFFLHPAKCDRNSIDRRNQDRTRCCSTCVDKSLIVDIYIYISCFTFFKLAHVPSFFPSKGHTGSVVGHGQFVLRGTGSATTGSLQVKSWL